MAAKCIRDGETFFLKSVFQFVFAHVNKVEKSLAGVGLGGFSLVILIRNEMGPMGIPPPPYRIIFT